jgi:lysyl-tRNA synthetase class 2
LEFYETYVDYNYMMDFVEKMFHFICEKIGETKFIYEGETIDLGQPFARKTMFGLLKEHVGVDLSDADENEMKKVCESKGIKTQDSDHYGNYIEYLFDEFVEPKLVQPTFVIDFPKAISPLAKLKRDGSEKIVERFELFIGAKEFSNAFSELNDPVDQEERLRNQERLGLEGDEEAQTFDQDFIQAMQYGMPPTGGVGIGIDRLTMLFTNQKSIRDVLLFPQMKT